MLVASIAQEESRFNEVRDVVFSPTEAKNSLEQQELNVYLDNKLPHYEVSSSNFIKDGVNLLVGDAQRTLNETADYYPRLEKHLHSNGICFAGTWSITKKTHYTGYFKQGAQGLIIARASTALTETQHGDTRAFGMEVKINRYADGTEKARIKADFQDQNEIRCYPHSGVPVRVICVPIPPISYRSAQNTIPCGVSLDK